MAEVRVDSLVGEDAAVVRLTVETGSNIWAFVGTSKKHPGDVADGTVGEALALSRALADASNKLTEYARNRTIAHSRERTNTFEGMLREAVETQLKANPVPKFLPPRV